MRPVARILMGAFLIVCGLATWAVGNFIILLMTGEWRSGAPTATSTSYWVMAPFTVAFAVMMFFVIRHIDRSLRR